MSQPSNATEMVISVQSFLIYFDLKFGKFLGTSCKIRICMLCGNLIQLSAGNRRKAMMELWSRWKWTKHNKDKRPLVIMETLFKFSTIEPSHITRLRLHCTGITLGSYQKCKESSSRLHCSCPYHCCSFYLNNNFCSWPAATLQMIKTVLLQYKHSLRADTWTGHLHAGYIIIVSCMAGPIANVSKTSRICQNLVTWPKSVSGFAFSLVQPSSFPYLGHSIKDVSFRRAYAGVVLDLSLQVPRFILDQTCAMKLQVWISGFCKDHSKCWNIS